MAESRKETPLLDIKELEEKLRKRGIVNPTHSNETPPERKDAGQKDEMGRDETEYDERKRKEKSTINTASDVLYLTKKLQELQTGPIAPYSMRNEALKSSFDKRHSIATSKFIERETRSPYTPTRSYLSPSTSFVEDEAIRAFQGTCVEEKMKGLVEAFKERTESFKHIITRPPTPEEDLEQKKQEEEERKKKEEEEAKLKEEQKKEEEKKEEEKKSGRKSWIREHSLKPDDLLRLSSSIMQKFKPPAVFDSQSSVYIAWLALVAMCFLYNVVAIPLRSVFDIYQTKNTLPFWLAADYFSDLVYLLDIVIFKTRKMFVLNGAWIMDPKETTKHYLQSTDFKIDVLALTPLDLFYFVFGIQTWLRFPRFLKVNTFWEFFDQIDKVLSNPHMVRVVRTVLYMLYLMHLVACIYYFLSWYEGIGSNSFVYDGVGNAYIRTFYFAQKTATSIGKNPKPTNLLEILVMTFSWLTGVFIFAMLIGQIRDIIATAGKSKDEYQLTVDGIMQYMSNMNLPESLHHKVRQWLTYTWEQQKSLDETLTLRHLSKKLRQDVAIGVHIATLEKVQMFKECDPRLLLDFVTKLKPIIYLPGDYVCRTGDVGREMFIVKSGKVDVVVGENKVVATLGEGSVFGEIALLGYEGQNRRTANIRCQGYSNLFVLTKDDFYESLKDFPEAEVILQKKAQELMKKSKEREKKDELKAKVIIPTRSQPKMIDAVMKALPRESPAAELLRTGSKYSNRLQDKKQEKPSQGNSTNQANQENQANETNQVNQAIQANQTNKASLINQAKENQPKTTRKSAIKKRRAPQPPEKPRFTSSKAPNLPSVEEPEKKDQQ